MIRRAALLTVFVAAIAAPTANAQTPPRPSGLAISDVSAWLASKGGEVSPVRREGDQTFFTVRDGGLTWAIMFHGCQADVCEDIQYSAVFASPSVTQEAVNVWNTEQRFLKAFFVPAQAGGNPSAAVQYDLLLHAGPVEQLTDPTSVWVGLLPRFATRVAGLTSPPAAAPATP